MPDLIVVAYDDEHMALERRTQLLKVQREYLIDLEDAAVAVKGGDGRVRLHQVVDLTVGGALNGGAWGALIGLLFLNPLLGAAAGAASGALAGRLTDFGIADDFIRELAQNLTPGTSALFVLARRMSPERLLEEVRGTGGKVMRTSLAPDAEARLQAALDDGLAPSRADLPGAAGAGEPPVGTSPAALGTGTQPQV